MQEHDAFVAAFVAEQSRIYRFIATLVPNRADVEELFQQTSLTLWRRRDDFRPDGEFRKWAFGIAFNIVRNFRRKGQSRQVLLSDDVLESLLSTHVEQESWIERAGTALGQCLEKLGARERELIECCYLEGGSIGEIAERRGQTANAVYKTLRRIRRALFQCISRSPAMEGLR